METDTDFKNLRIPIAYPNKDYPTTMDRVEVEYADDMYKVTLVPFDCGYDYKLLTIAGSTITGTDSADSDTVTSTLGGGKMVTTRITSGQKPLKGKLKFTYNGMESNDIEVFNSTAGKLEKELELFQDIGSLTVTQTKESTCANQQYNVQFDSSPGNRPELQITSQLTWPEAGAKAEIITLRDGFLSYDPIGGDIALSCFSEPQVRVYINGIPTKCELTGHNCTVTWSTDATPTVTQLSITEGNEGDTLEISGTLFSTTSTNNIVTIGGVPCEVTFSSETKIKCTVGRGQLNTYPVKVTVAGKGIASGNKNFTYTTDMTDITPEWSTLGGYVNLTVIGKGFSDDTVVMIGTEECIKTDIRIPVEINCQVPPYTDLSVTSNQTVIVSATTKGVQTTSTFTFTYAYTSAEISDILISAGEGQRRKRSTAAKLTVQGRFFKGLFFQAFPEKENSYFNVKFLTWNKEVKLLQSLVMGWATQEMFLLERLNWKLYFEMIQNSIPTVDVILTVSKIYPTAGSKFGGTPLTIIGEGFGSIKADAVVSVGDYKCIVDSVTDNQIKCDIESTVKTHYVFNNGTTGEQYPYSFDKLVVKVQQGDAVQWQWTTPSWLVDVKHGIAETETLDSVEDKKGGISSGEKTQQGQFIQTFTELRDHYFWTYVDYNRKFYRMTVKVEPRSAETKSVSVFVAGQEAFYNVSSGQDDPTSTSGCSLAIADIVGCDTETASVPDSSKFSFRFSCLKTPIVNAITFQKADNVLENSALMTTPITFSGKGFASSDCANQAKIGDCACNVDTSTSTSFVCTPIASCEYDTRVYQALSLRVNQYGYALVNIEKTIDRSVAFLPLITGFTPKSGSAKGGTTVTISGKAFTNDATKVQVSFDGTDADCSDVEKSKLVCTTPYKSSTGSAPIAVRIDGVSAVCDSNIQCNFNYNASITPTVSSVTPTAVSAKTSLTFTGEELGTDSSKLSVTVGGENCYGINIVTDETSVSCYVDAIPAGKNAVKLTVSGVGDASTDVEVTGDASASVSPSTGSIYGHTELTLTGHGFVEGLSIQVNGVDICEKTDVQSLTTATCVTKAHGGAGAVTIIVTSNGVAYDAVDFEFSAASSPTIDSINPTSGAVDTTVTISGNHFGTNGADIKVYIGDAECIDVSLSEGDITCTTGAQSSGTYDTVVQVTGKGRSNTTTFTYEVTVTSFNPLTGDSGGNQLLTLNGNGFTASMKVTVCDNVCSFHKLLSSSQYLCVTPKGTAGQCKVKVTEGSASPVEAPTDYIYVNNASPSVTGIDPSGGGTGGNTDMTITGERFSDTKSEVSVEVDGVACEVTSSTLTQIVCSTGAHNGTKLSEVVVLVNNLRATAATDNILRFLYADVWNSTFTWGGGPVPAEGEMVVIPEGQSILLDTDTNILEMLLIQGKALNFHF
ncbi:fibrocystin-L-like [Mercenaria mercenaria]|uniref:fibrocystin-L-like n=1 Tax=Mercenaria mercenaria TaxID=6596 RepID=UPI00234E75EA|nr:fibrocystin-L-like [Mercenaria mercenaria]